MPAARIDGSPWMLQSEDILRELGYQKVSDEDMLALFRALRGGVHRVDSGPRFWYEWSLVRDQHPRLLPRLPNHFLRAFSVLYFHLALKGLARNTMPPTPEAIGRQYSYWERKLGESGGPYIEGEAPGTRDLMLFGGVQCHASISGPPISALQSDSELTRLRSWVSLMQKRFAGYEHLYSGMYFDPRCAAPPSTTMLERLAFWLGAGFTWVAAPITIPLARYYTRRVRKRGMLRIPSSRPRASRGAVGTRPSP